MFENDEYFAVRKDETSLHDMQLDQSEISVCDKEYTY